MVSIGIGMEILHQYHPERSVIELPYSKSIINRLALLSYPQPLELDAQLMNDDIQSMQVTLEAIQQGENYHIEEAGTVWRFCIALAAALPKYRGSITAGPHLIKRPIQPLIEILNTLGARIEPIANGFKIHGAQLAGREINLSPQLSSQFISALMMVAPRIQDGLTLKIDPKQQSQSYIHLTYTLMRSLGFRLSKTNDAIRIESFIPEPLQHPSPFFELDASASTFFMAYILLHPQKEILLSNMTSFEHQAEEGLLNILQEKGLLQCEAIEEGVLLKGQPTHLTELEIDFSNFPDAALNIILACVLRKIKIKARGLESLNHKESLRLNHLIDWLERMGYQPQYEQGVLSCTHEIKSLHHLDYSSHQDHRIAMALALIASQFPVKLKEKEVVTKSYPYFWEQLQHLGYHYA